VLHLADLLNQLVGQRKTHVLTPLLQTGREYRDLNAARLTEIVRQLQPQVDQLADALSLELEPGRDYAQVWHDAHEQIGVLAEELVSGATRPATEEDAYARLSEQAGHLTSAMQSFLSTGPGQSDGAKSSQSTRDDVPAERRLSTTAAGTPVQFQNSSTLLRKLNAAAARCRQSRRELSLLLFDLRGHDDSAPTDYEASRRLRRAIDQACKPFDDDDVALVAIGDHCAAAVICDCDRRAAIAASQTALRDLSLSTGGGKNQTVAHDIALSVGVATASIVPKNFDATRLLECAERCLGAARSCGISTVKSIEV
jgi:hypothetical protein